MKNERIFNVRQSLAGDDIENRNYACIHRAKEAARSLDKSARYKMVIHGDYYLTQPLTIDERDCGLTVEGADASAVIYGGLKLSDWSLAEEGVAVADLSKNEITDIRMLLMNGAWCNRSRLPENGYYSCERICPAGTSDENVALEQFDSQEFFFKLKYSKSDKLEQYDLSSSELGILHSWSDSYVQFKDLDRENNLIFFRNPTTYFPGEFGVMRFEIFNVKAGMTQPGSWYHDKCNQRLYYRLQAGEDPSQLRAIIPCTRKIFDIHDTHTVDISHLTISVTNNHVTMENLLDFGKATLNSRRNHLIAALEMSCADQNDGAIMVNRSKYCHIAHVKFQHLSGNALKVIDSSDIAIKHSSYKNIGSSAMSIAACTQIGIYNNFITDTGLIRRSGAGIVCIDVLSLQVCHNTLIKSGGMGIALSTCHGARVSGNRVKQALSQVFSDGGAIYLGVCNHPIISHNHVSEIAQSQPGHYGAHSYYIDAWCMGAVLEYNVSERNESPLHLHTDYDTRITNNYFISDGPLSFSTGCSKNSIITHNVICAVGDIVFRDLSDQSMVHNLFFTKKGSYKFFEERYRMKPATIDIFDLNINRQPKIREYKKDCYCIDPKLAMRFGILPINLKYAGVFEDDGQPYAFWFDEPEKRERNFFENRYPLMFDCISR